ncbi:hypothetical protein M758_UG100400 [Ceratodon purpureus]|nr:hypothetical protein M758_UG100400 [Ceratodon purpureus]
MFRNPYFMRFLTAMLLVRPGVSALAYFFTSQACIVSLSLDHVLMGTMSSGHCAPSSVPGSSGDLVSHAGLDPLDHLASPECLCVPTSRVAGCGTRTSALGCGS